MSSAKGASTAVDAEILAMRESLGAASETELAEMLGYSQASISQWRRRGKIPDKARRRLESYKEGGRALMEMEAHRKFLGHQILYEGRCLALFLAPSIDATISRRFSLANYMGNLREFASFFDEITLACADEIHECMTKISGNATEAFESLSQSDPKELYLRVLERAKIWRFGNYDLEE